MSGFQIPNAGINSDEDLESPKYKQENAIPRGSNKGWEGIGEIKENKGGRKPRGREREREREKKKRTNVFVFDCVMVWGKVMDMGAVEGGREGGRRKGKERDTLKII